jgi:hypothetical protein
MGASEHLLGCDLRHTSRQHCSTWVPAPRIDREIADQDHPRLEASEASSRHTLTFIKLGCIGSASAFLLAALVVAGGCAALRLAFMDEAPELPPFAYPAGAVLHSEDDYPLCDKSGEPCRYLSFRSTVAFDITQAQLIEEFEDRSWSANHYRGGADGSSYVLWAKSPGEDVCVRYLAIPPGSGPGYLPDAWRITVTVDPCPSDTG